MSAPVANTPPPRRARPVWPLWVAFALVLLPGTVALGLLGGAKDDASERLALQREAVGASVVVTGVLVDTETNAGLPTATGLYEVTVQDAQGREQTAIVGGDSSWGFPPSTDFAPELSFLVLQGDPPRALAHGPVGSIEPVTADTVQDAQGGSALAQTLWVAGIVLFWVLVLGLPTLAIILTARRRRSRPPGAAPTPGAASTPGATPTTGAAFSPGPPPAPRI